MREKLNWSYAPFEIPQEYYSVWDAKQKGLGLEKNWQALFTAYSKKYPGLAAEFTRRINHQLPIDFSKTVSDTLEKYLTTPENIASRKASQNCINALSPIFPEFLGGSADLTGSNLTMAKTAKAITPEDFHGNYIYYGVREFGMSAIMCGLSLHGGFIPFGGTFLTFCDYARNAVRLAALMKIRVIFVYSHDSIGLGEDGPTHQPVEHIGMLRLTPNLSLWRPCDPIETMISWQAAIENSDKPTCLLLSRQNLPQQDHQDINVIKKGGYILSDSDKSPEIILIATGSEVYLATDAAKILRETHHKSVRVVSMPSVDTFLLQDQTYQEKVLPKNSKNRIAIEAGAKDIWYRFVGFEGKIIGMDTFGESAPAPAIYKALGITTDNIVKTALEFNLVKA